MKINLKSLKQIPYEVEIDSEDVFIKELKNEIQKKHGFDAECIKILFKGSMLNDDKQIKEYNITENDTLTMMNPKVKPQNLNVLQESKIIEESKQNLIKDNKQNENKGSNNKNTENKENKDKQNNSKSIVSNTHNSLSNKNNSGCVDSTNDYSNEIKKLTEMGFNENEAARALKAVKGNIERAIEFLYNLNDSNNPINNQNVSLFQESYDPEEECEEQEEGYYDERVVPLTFEVDPHMLDQLDLKDPDSLKTIASFVKVLISEDPSSLQNLLEDIEETNPEIIEYIKKHEDEFKKLIESPLEDKDLEKLLPIANDSNLNIPNKGISREENIEGKSNLNENEEDEDSEMVVNENIIKDSNIDSLKQSLNTIEKESCERLKTLGFNDQEVYQAFIACDKNEMLTANFLLENNFKDINSMDIDGNYTFI